MALTRRRAAAAAALIGAVATVTGITMIYLPAALIAGGLGLLAFGLAADVGPARGERR